MNDSLSQRRRDPSLHKGHRQRLRQKYKQSGLDALEPHEILELLLFYAIPQSDTNELAHRLLKRFGSLANVFDASVDSLMQIKGIGEIAACLISFQGDMCRQYLKSEHNLVNEVLNNENIGELISKRFCGITVEQMHMICLNGKNRIISEEMVCEGTVDSVIVYTRKIVARALELNAKKVILAHNHPNGVLQPSQADRDTTKMIEQALRAIDVTLLDHLIVAHGQYCSMRIDFNWI